MQGGDLLSITSLEEQSYISELSREYTKYTANSGCRHTLSVFRWDCCLGRLLNFVVAFGKVQSAL